MAFDAGMVAAIVSELNSRLLDAKVEKVQQPEHDEILLSLYSRQGSAKLSLNVSSNNPKIIISTIQKENPIVAPNFCMLLRKHLTGAKITEIIQPDFERAVRIKFETKDEMGFSEDRYLVCEVMGRFSNLILCDGNMKMIGILKPVDFSTSQLRQLLPGMTYELPPKQDKRNPLFETEGSFREYFEQVQKNSPDLSASKFIMNGYLGISPLVSREIAFLACGEVDMPISDVSPERLSAAFFEVVNVIKNQNFNPCMILDGSRYVEYSFFDINQYGKNFEKRYYQSVSQLVETFYAERDRAESLKQSMADLQKLINNVEQRLIKKIALQTEEIVPEEKREQLKQYGDLINANIYRIKRGDTLLRAQNYYDPDMAEVEIELNPKLSPSANAQRYFKQYNKAKKAAVELKKQIEAARKELDYLATVSEALRRAESKSDVDEIRSELYEAGYASKMKGYLPKRVSKSKPIEYRTSGGYLCLCGKNNTQNDFLTLKKASKRDIFFHVKNAPGSHVILFVDSIYEYAAKHGINLGDDPQPSDRDLIEAAMIAAVNSKLSSSNNVPVDYTQVKNIKKPSGAKPGYVIYSTNGTLYVKPDKETVDALKIGK